MTTCQRGELIPHVPDQHQEVDLDDALDESRSILNAARIEGPSEVCTQGTAKSRESDGQQSQNHHRDARQIHDPSSQCKNPGIFASEALSTLNEIQAMINIELGRDVRTSALGIQ
jgi:hypothetical protein